MASSCSRGSDGTSDLFLEHPLFPHGDIFVGQQVRFYGHYVRCAGRVFDGLSSEVDQPGGVVMGPVYTVPTFYTLEEHAKLTPDYMYPNQQPYIVLGESQLEKEVCEGIVEELRLIETYPFPGCEAVTRECPRPLSEVLDPIHQFAMQVNRKFWNYTLDDRPAAWLQTYEVGDSYQLHMDGTIAQSRKMTAIALLTDPEEYKGGELIFRLLSDSVVVPKKQGTIVVFPPWMTHEVLAVESGIRQTLNMGFYGPPFR